MPKAATIPTATMVTAKPMLKHKTSSAPVATRHGLTILPERIAGAPDAPQTMLPALTAAENAAVPLIIGGWSRRKAVVKAKEMLAEVGLADRVHSFPNQLSGGQQQRVAIARAIVTDPALLVADEPTGDLDAKSAGEILDLMQRLNTEFGKTIVMVTHDPNAAARASRILHLEKGVLVEDTHVAKGAAR